MSATQVDILYAQFAVFDPELRDPFNDWTKEHVDQGFAWRPGSVSFGTLEGGGPLTLQVITSHALDESTSTAERIITVPFRVPVHEVVELGSIPGGVEINLPAGEHELSFEHGRDQQGLMWANVYFRPVPTPARPRIIRADPALSPPRELVMTARPA